MEIPPAIEDALPALTKSLEIFTTDYQGKLSEVKGVLTITIECYNKGGNQPGVLWRINYAEGNEKMSKTVDNGPGEFSTDWARVSQ